MRPLRLNERWPIYNEATGPEYDRPAASGFSQATGSFAAEKSCRLPQALPRRNHLRKYVVCSSLLVADEAANRESPLCRWAGSREVECLLKMHPHVVEVAEPTL